MTSESDEFTVADVAAEFEIESLDEYLERSMAHRRKYGPATG